jgi:TPR repeat protein
MKIFIAYASDDRRTADSISLTLRSRGHIVFFDRDDLPPGGGYDQQIESAVQECDIFVFLVSPESVTQGRYTLTELAFARDKWPNPTGHVLPVMARPTPRDHVDPYLKAVVFLEPRGDIAAETGVAVDKMWRNLERGPPTTRPPRKRLVVGSALGAMCISAVAAWLLTSTEDNKQQGTVKVPQEADDCLIEASAEISTEARRLFERGAQAGSTRAQVRLGYFYEKGLGGLPKDDREAVRFFKLAADQGNACGQANLGRFYSLGLGGLPKDDHGSARLFKLAADQGNASGQANLGRFYSLGLGGLPKDDREAVRLYKLAADQGDANGQNGLGVFYVTGRGGLPKDDREAARLFKLAADQGNARAQANLGFGYELGQGGLPKDDREAARLFKLAADQGYERGQYGLGRFYELGKGGLPKDEREAARLYKLAADQGNESARAALNRLEH